MTTPEQTEEQTQPEQPIQPHEPGFWDHHSKNKLT